MNNYVKDNQGRIPTYVIENDNEGFVQVRNQFTGDRERVGVRPYSNGEVRAAMRALVARSTAPAGCVMR